MDSSAKELGAFLASRRGKLTPDRVGLPSAPNRRVPGLRRGELAALAGVSVEYLSRLERGAARGVSEAVLHALARALQLDDAEYEHLRDLARAVQGSAPRPRQRRSTVRPSVQLLVDSIATAPALVWNGRTDILAINRLGRALYSEMYSAHAGGVNHARFIFFDPRARAFYPNWDRAADDIVAILRTDAGRDPYDRELSDLIGELSTRSEEFRTRWAAQNVMRHQTGTKRFHHPIVGDVTLMFESLAIAADDGLSLVVYLAPEASPDHDALTLLTAWQASSENAPNPDTRSL